MKVVHEYWSHNSNLNFETDDTIRHFEWSKVVVKGASRTLPAEMLDQFRCVSWRVLSHLLTIYFVF